MLGVHDYRVNFNFSPFSCKSMPWTSMEVLTCPLLIAMLSALYKLTGPLQCLRMQLKIFPRLFTGFSDTDEIWTTPKEKWYLSDILPFFRTSVLGLAGLKLICAHAKSLFSPWRNHRRVVASRTGQGAPTFYFCGLDEHVHCQSKQGHWYCTTNDDAFL